MREYFVDHKGKKKLTVHRFGNKHTVNFASVAKEFSDLLDGGIKDKSLKDWVLPNFSTTTKTDITVGAIMMMATLKNYFKYYSTLCCGVPSVTLQGTKDDWVALRSRLSKLLDFGPKSVHPDLHAWHDLLVPTLTFFVNVFDAFSPKAPSPKRAEEIRDFFSRICDVRAGSGFTYICGWLAFFTLFGGDGKSMLIGPRGDCYSYVD
ncbi:hypothetical protein BDD12DRAFT_923551 [Trichophaea hybrida]|nr:hypothetical protein BDD12DRAFT_923551 [Trichophaea hybrida]